jgi:hypothetical protein
MFLEDGFNCFFQQFYELTGRNYLNLIEDPTYPTYYLLGRRPFFIPTDPEIQTVQVGEG